MLHRPGIKRTILIMLALLVVATLLHLPATAVSGAGQNSIKIEINGEKAVFTGAHPYIDANSRTMVPVRFISENLGAQVDWYAPTETVTVTKEGTVIKLQVGSNIITVNRKEKQMDTRMVFNQQLGRNYVPLRFISENLGTAVDYRMEGTTTHISITDASAGPTVPAAPPVAQEYSGPKGIYGIFVGDSATAVLSTIGEPIRKDPGAYGYTWWVYHDNYHDYLLLGIGNNDKVVNIYTNSVNWEYEGIRTGTGRNAVRRILTYEAKPQFAYETATFTIIQQQNGEKDLFIIDNSIAVQVYYDIHENNTVTSIRISELNFILWGSFSKRWTFPQGDPPDFAPPVLSRAEQTAVDQANDRQLFDLVNAVRKRMELHTLNWHEGMAGVAYSHSVDMYQNNFFAHFSPQTGNPGDRVKAADIPFSYLAENIAHGQTDAIEAHEGLMNSAGHRKNILKEQVNALGTGSYFNYYTQKFLKTR